MTSLRNRIVLTILGAVLGAGLAMVALVTGPLTWLAFAGGAQIFQAVPKEALASCEQAPSDWVYRNEHGVEAWVLDASGSRLLHPEAPTLPWILQARLALGEQEPVVLGRWDGGGVLVQRRTGRCDAIVVFWPIPDHAYRRTYAGLLVVLFGTLSAAGLITWLLLLRPLLGSVRALDRASRAVGTPAFGPPEVVADLRAVRSALIEADIRVEEDRRRLVDERERLERHIADVAHDLRSPLAALQLRLERVANGEPGAVGGAMADVAYLGLLTENLATTGQLRSGLRDMDGEVDLGAVAQRVAERFAVLGRQKGVEVVAAVPDAPVRVRGRPVYVEQLVANLVHNGVHHHDGDGTVVVVVEPGSPVVLEIADDGPGSPADLPVARANATQAHGLGLSIVRALADQLGWTSTIEAASPRGLVFRFVIAPPSDVNTSV